MLPVAVETPDLVKYGEGLDIEQIVLGKVRRDMQAGTYVVDEAARAEVTTALATISDPAVPDPTTDELKHILHHPRNKELRNAMTSFAIEQAWPAYADVVTHGGFYAIAFDRDGRSSLHPIRGHDRLSAAGIARLMGASNQNVLTHFICKRFEAGTPLMISGIADIDADYFEAYKEQTELDIYATSNFRTIPTSAGGPSVFTTSGTVGIRTHIFGLPNLIDHRAARRGFWLDNDAHRQAFELTMRTVTAPQYLPTTTVAIAASMPLADDERRGLDWEKWTDSGDPGHFFVYPKPEYIRAKNAKLVAMQTHMQTLDPPESLPAETHCPAFHGRVPSIDTPGRLMPLPRGLLDLSLVQLDRDFYPRRIAA